MSTLYLDIGNSFLKLAKPNGADWKILFDGELHRFDELCAFINSSTNSEKIILSSVRKDVRKKLMMSLSGQVIHEFKTSDIPSKMLDYKTPHTLGLDRFLVCLGAWAEIEKNDIVVVDAGSACTVDMMTKEGIYSGGVIMPGLHIIRQAMNERLPELPETGESIPKDWPGKSTQECIEWGVNGGVMMAIRGFIHNFKNITENPTIYITGGNAKKIMEWMDEGDPMIYKKNLIWDGLKKFERIVQK